ncbi:MAG TPA: glycosyltransferase family 4 protein [Alphaproteobacteria bacterium]|nr:glycosyltransferase family 4 protein [Alphaproteobacteria bacterium]
MPVLHLMQCTNLGGMEQVSYRLMDTLGETMGLSFRIATPLPFGPGRPRVIAQDPAAADSPGRGRFGWRDFPAFRRHVHALAADCSHAWVTGTSASALAALLGLNKPKVLSHHYHHFEGSRPWLRWRGFYELLCRQLDAITYPTAFTHDEALRIAPWLKSRAVVVPNGFEIHCPDEATRLARRARAREALGLPQDAPVIGNAGWLIPRKRFDVFLKTAARVHAARPDAVFVICGGGPLEDDLKRMAAALGIAGAVRFFGWVQDLNPHYEAWDALLFNSDFDTLPAAPMEAASRGCVTVASLLYGGLGEFIEHGQSGYLFDRHDEAALAEALLRLTSDSAQAEALRAGAIAKLRRDFSIERATAFYRDFFG